MGSGAVFLNKTPSEVDVICDADADIANLWRVLKDAEEREEFFEEFMKMTVSKELFNNIKQQKKLGYPNITKVQAAICTYYLIMYSFDGNRLNMRYRNKPENWKEMEIKAKRSLCNNWNAIVKRISNAIVLNENALNVLGIIKNREEATILLDPPYLPELLGSNKHLYEVHFTEEEHVKMLELVQDAKARIIICGYRGVSCLYDRYLNKDTGWHCYVVDDRLLKSCQKKNKKDFATEFVWTNYKLAEDMRFFINITDWALTQKEADEMYKYEMYEQGKNQIKNKQEVEHG